MVDEAFRTLSQGIRFVCQAKSSSAKSYASAERNGETEVAKSSPLKRFCEDDEVGTQTLPSHAAKRHKSVPPSEYSAVHVEWSGATGPLPAPADSFHKLPLPDWLLTAVSQTLQWKAPTPVQAHLLPIALKYPHAHFLVRAPTGSGKTACYLLPLLYHLHCTVNKQEVNETERERVDGECGDDHALRERPISPRALILLPTPELAHQTLRVCTLLTSHHTFLSPSCAILPSDPHTRLNVEVLLATPKLAARRLHSRQLSLEHVEFVVLDEVDALLRDSTRYVDIVLRIVCARRTPLSLAMYSATITPAIESLAKTVLIQPCLVRVGPPHAAKAHIQQQLCFVGNDLGRKLAIQRLIREGIEPPVIIFCNSSQRAKQAYSDLLTECDDTLRSRVELLIPDRSAEERLRLVHHVRLRHIWILLTTDILSRGLHPVASGPHRALAHTIINYDMPRDAETYIHRVGRGLKAVTFYTVKNLPKLRKIVTAMQNTPSEVPFEPPDWLFYVLPKRKRQRQRQPLHFSQHSSKHLKHPPSHRHQQFHSPNNNNDVTYEETSLQE
jgi:ATP-dependent RNA helicase DDX52/ROK1